MNKIGLNSSSRCYSSRKSFQQKHLSLTQDGSQTRSSSLKKGIKVLSKQPEVKKPQKEVSTIKKYTESLIKCGMCETKLFDIKKQLQINMLPKKGEFNSLAQRSERRRFSHKKLSLAKPLQLQNEDLSEQFNIRVQKVEPYTPINKLNIF